MDAEDEQEQITFVQPTTSSTKKKKIILTASASLLNITSDDAGEVEIPISTKRSRVSSSKYEKGNEETTSKTPSKTPRKENSKVTNTKTPSKSAAKESSSSNKSNTKTPSKVQVTKTPSSKKTVAANTVSDEVVFEEIPEDEIDGDLYNEVDPNEESGEILRTLVQFSIYKKDTKELISLDEIEVNAGNVSMSGVVLEPFPAEWRETMLNLLSTTSREETADDSMQIEEPCMEEENSEKPPALDWESLTVGDLVDGYCPRTYQWYETKIVQADRNNDRFKVHFQGWNSKYDEWINKGSDRLIPHRASKLLLKEVEKAAKLMVPWFNTGSLLNNMSKKLNQSIPEQSKQGIYIPDVVDWCVDYTYGNPTLWVISSSDIWYRLAGALTPYGCFGNPKSAYRPVFDRSLEKYLAAAHVAMAVLDVFPTLPNANFQVIVDEVTSRSSGEINEVVILEHYKFISEQLATISPPVEWNPKTTIQNSLFMNHLVKEGEAYDAAGGLEALKNGSYKGQGVKKRMSIVKESMIRDGEIVPGTETKKRKRGTSSIESGSENEEAEENQKKGSKKKAAVEYVPPPPPPPKKEFLDVPTFDDNLWSFIARKKPEALDPLPIPSSSRQPFVNVSDSKEKFTIVEQLFYIFNVANNFKIPLALTEFTIFDLEASVSSNKDIGLFRAICISMLEEIMKERRCKGANRTTLKKIEDEESEMEQDKASADALPWSLPILLPIYDSITDTLSTDNFLRTGEAWQEVLLYWIKHENPEVFALLSLDEIDPMLLCKRLLDDLNVLCDNTVFASLAKVSETQYPGYRDGVRQFLDLKILGFRLENGWYDPVEGESNVQDASEKAAPDAIVVDIVGGPDAYYIPGQLVDVYNVEFGRWYEAIIVKRIYDEQNKTVIAYLIQYVGWPYDLEETVSVEEDRIIPYRAASGQRMRRVMTPDEVMAEFPEYINVSKELSGDVKNRVTVQTSRGRGHLGFAEDVREICTNWIKYTKGSEAASSVELLAESERLLTYFNQRYDEEIVKKLEIARNTNSRGLQTLLEEDVSQGNATSSHRVHQRLDVWKLKLQQYSTISDHAWNEIISSHDLFLFCSFLELHGLSIFSLSINSKVRIVHWLCMEFLSTDFARNHLNKMKLFADKNDIDLAKLIPNLVEDIKEEAKEEVVEDMKEGDEDKGENEDQNIYSRVKRVRKSASQDSLNKATAEEDKQAEAKKKAQAAIVSDEANPSREETVVVPLNSMEELIASKCFGRMEPLGKDRFGNLYWTFPSELLEPAIYCEVHVDDYRIFSADGSSSKTADFVATWRRYSDAKDIFILIQWLNEYGYDESVLLKNIVQWTIAQGMSLSSIADVHSKANSELDVNDVHSLRSSTDKVGDLIKIRKGRKKTDASVSYDFITHCRHANFQLQIPPISVHKWIEDWLKEYYEAKAMGFTEYAVENGVVLLKYVKFTSAERQLGMGVKQIHGKFVFVTSFLKEAMSPAEKAGLRVGDRVLVAGDQYVDSISKLQSSIKSFVATIPEVPAATASDCYRLPILVYRLKDPLKDPAFKELHHHSHEIKQSLQNQKNVENAKLQLQVTKTKESAVRSLNTVYPDTEVNSIDLSVTAVIKLAEECNHPVCTSADWRKVEHPQWLIKITNARNELTADDDRTSKSYLRLIQCLSSFLLALESDLHQMSTLQHDDWILNATRLRFQWQQLCKSTFRHEKLSYLVGILRASIDWNLFKQSTIPIPSANIKQQLQDLHIKYSILSFLQPEKKLLFFREGYDHAVDRLQKYYALKYVGNHQLWKRAVLWGESQVPSGNGALVCWVKQVKVFAGLLPFAQVTLELKPCNTPAVPKLLPAFPKKECNRLLEKVLNMIKKSHNHRVFLEPVKVEEYPDYYDVVKKPMDLITIQNRIHKEKYTSPYAFLQDMKLIYDNCCLYNGADNKKFPPIAESMWKDATKFCQSIFGEEAVLAPIQESDTAKTNKRNSPTTTTDDAVISPAENKDTAAPSAPPATVTNPASGTTSTASKTFTVCIQLDSEEDSFLVDYDAYVKSVRHLANSKVTIGSSLVYKQLPPIPGDNQDRYATGIVAGAKENLVNNEGAWGQLLPWEYLKVDWLDPQDVLLPSYVNPWEVQIDGQ